MHVPHLKEFAFVPGICPGEAVPEETVLLITALTAHNSLECLLLSKIDVEDCQVLHELLSSCLKWLHILGGYLLPEALELIISGLHSNTALTRLDMEKNMFSHHNSIKLASVLRQITPLFTSAYDDAILARKEQIS